MANAKDPRIAYRGTPEQRKRLKHLAVERETSVQKILDEAVEDYLEKMSTGTASTNVRESYNPNTSTRRSIGEVTVASGNSDEATRLAAEQRAKIARATKRAEQPPRTDRGAKKKPA